MIGWRGLFGVFATVTACCAAMIYLVVPEAPPVASSAASFQLRKIYTDPRFWRLAPLSATSIGTAWALQGLWAAQWLTDVERLDRTALVWHLFTMAVALSLGAILLGVAADRLRRRGVGPQIPLGLGRNLLSRLIGALANRIKQRRNGSDERSRSFRRLGRCGPRKSQ